jgi:hypothetical protein
MTPVIPILIATILTTVLMLLLIAMILILRLRYHGGSGKKHQQCATDHPHIPLLVHDPSPLEMTRTGSRDGFGELRGTGDLEKSRVLSALSGWRAHVGVKISVK